MKVFIDCDCEILQAGLNSFLADILVDKEYADFIICDTKKSFDKPVFIVGEDIVMPFTKAELQASLDEFWRKKFSNIDCVEKNLDEILARLKSDLMELFKNAR